MALYLNISNDSLVLYAQSDFVKSGSKANAWISGEVVKNEVKGVYSRKSKKRFEVIIKNWLSTLEIERIEKKEKKDYVAKKLRFVTLTLSDKQKDSDKFIRRQMLNRFLQEIKRKHQVKNYVYCSESQKNGNIHFHIVIDSYINYKKIQDIWNNIQSDNGYLENFEKKYKHRKPNSTDIHRLNKIKNISAYLIKYFTKDENRRKIEGRLWGATDNLRELSHFGTLATGEDLEYLTAKKRENQTKYYEGDFFTTFSDITFEKIKREYPVLYTEIRKHYEKNSKYLKTENMKNEKTKEMETKKIKQHAKRKSVKTESQLETYLLITKKYRNMPNKRILAEIIMQENPEFFKHEVEKELRKRIIEQRKSEKIKSKRNQMKLKIPNADRIAK